MRDAGIDPRYTRSAPEEVADISIEHLIFIPLVLGLGVFIGWTYGTRSKKGEVDRMQGELEQHEIGAAAARLARARIADGSDSDEKNEKKK